MHYLLDLYHISLQSAFCNSSWLISISKERGSSWFQCTTGRGFQVQRHKKDCDYSQVWGCMAMIHLPGMASHFSQSVVKEPSETPLFSFQLHPLDFMPKSWKNRHSPGKALMGTTVPLEAILGTFCYKVWVNLFWRVCIMHLSVTTTWSVGINQCIWTCMLSSNHIAGGEYLAKVILHSAKRRMKWHSSRSLQNEGS